MNISSTSLFHFTSKLENLKSIIENDFFAQFSVETFYNIIIGESDPDLEKAIPMVCFCDIPLSQVTKHTKFYGAYAIGLTKEWAIKNKINPIIYSYSKSDLTDNIKSLSMGLAANKTEEGENLYNYMSAIIQYIKPYEGVLKKGNKTFKKVRFYNEKEWRYIAKLFDEKKPSWMKKPDNGDLNPSEVNKRLLELKFDKAKLKFDSHDIKHIIVKTEKEIPKMIQAINSMKTNKYTIVEAQILLTKIISLDQIIEDY